MKKITLIAFFLSSVTISSAQFNQYDRPVIHTNQATTIIKEIKPKTIDIPSAVYLTDKWVKTNLVYKSEYVIQNLKCKYDINSELFEVNADTIIQIINTADIDSFSYEEDGMQYNYINCKHFPLEDYMHGFFRVLSHGKIRLLEKPAVNIIEPDYNVALDVGHKERRYVLTFHLYVQEKDVVRELPRKKKDIRKLFLDKESEVNAFVKENKLKLKKSEDLAKAINYYNQL
jgi:hypothetical protein